MAKTTRVVSEGLEPDPVDVLESQQEQERKEMEGVDPLIIQQLATKVELSDMALLEVSQYVEKLEREIASLNTRLDEERTARVSASMNTIANMNQDELSLLVFTLTFQKYLDYENNDLERIGSDKSIAASGMMALVKAHKNLVDGLCRAIRYS